mmetsp:Transcript_14081/g.38527  ORF Transcript_14081/g.38527 Transcript_14081/m.38527 type:complete len:471 (+) Transcript_14081:75-1487(+)
MDTPVLDDSRRRPSRMRRALRIVIAANTGRAGLPPEKQRMLLVVAVWLDLTAAALVVPLLPVRLKALGASQRASGLMGSMFSLAQIIGGLALGALSDRHLGRRGLLQLSFVGAGISYAIVGMPNVSLELLVLSRVVVGLVKQSMTASMAMMTELTEAGVERTFWLGRLSSIAQIAWTTGTALGGALNNYGTSTPAVVAIFLYCIDLGLIRLGLPSNSAVGDVQGLPPRQSSRPGRSLRAVFGAIASPALARVVVVTLASSFVLRASFTTRLLYELDRWSLTATDIGVLASYKSVVGIVTSWQVAGALSRRYSARALLRGASLVSFLAYVVEALPDSLLQRCGGNAWISLAFLLPARVAADPSLFVFALICHPVNATAIQVMSIALRSRFTELVPKDRIASAFASLDVFQSVVGVVAPLVSGLIFNGLAPTAVPLRYACLEFGVLCFVLFVYPADVAKDGDGDETECNKEL